MEDARGKEVSKFPIFAKNASNDPFDFGNIIISTSGYEIRLTQGAVDIDGKVLPDHLRVMVESEDITQRLWLLYGHGVRHNTVTAIINDVSRGYPTGIYYLLHDIKAPFYKNVAEKDMDTDTLKRCFMKSVERVAIVEKQFGFSILNEDERKRYAEQYDLFKKEGYQPVELANIRTLMKEEMPEMKKKVEVSVQSWKDSTASKQE